MISLLELKTNLWQYLTVLMLTVILVIAVWLGLGAGKNKAQSEVVLANTQVLQQGLQFFYQDQDRFPSDLEFSSKGIMSQYVLGFPPQNFASKACQLNFAYKRLSFQSYILSFCLPVKTDSYVQGWNVIKK